MSFSASTATANSSVLGLPGIPTGYQVNVQPNNSQTIYTNAFALNGILDISTSEVSFGCFLSKVDNDLNTALFTLPSEASVVAGNLWVATEGLVPDTLNIDTVQGDVDGLPEFFADGVMMNFIPFPEDGTIMNSWVYLAADAVPSINNPLYVRTDGTLTIDATDASIASAAYSVGYILQQTLGTVTDAGFYQLQIVIKPQYILQP